MNVKKEVILKIIDLLEKEHTRCNNKIHDNCYAFKKLAEEQTILKREKAKLSDMIYTLKGDIK